MDDEPLETFAGFSAAVLIALAVISFRAASDACLIQTPDFAGAARKMLPQPTGSPTLIEGE